MRRTSICAVLLAIGVVWSASDADDALLQIGDCKITAPLPQSDGQAKLSSTCPIEVEGGSAQDERIAELEAEVRTLQQLLPPLGSARRIPAPSCSNVSFPGLAYVGSSIAESRLVYCDGAGWTLLATNKVLPANFRSKDDALWSSGTAPDAWFQYNGEYMAMAYLGNAVASVPFTQLRFPWGETVTWDTASTFVVKRNSRAAPVSSTYGWYRSTSGTYTSVTCLFCKEEAAGYGDNSLTGLVTHATSSLSCADNGVGCGADSDCGYDFPVASTGHRGNGNQNCDNAAWIR